MASHNSIERALGFMLQRDFVAVARVSGTYQQMACCVKTSNMPRQEGTVCRSCLNNAMPFIGNTVLGSMSADLCLGYSIALIGQNIKCWIPLVNSYNQTL